VLRAVLLRAFHCVLLCVRACAVGVLSSTMLYHKPSNDMHLHTYVR